MDAEEFRAAGHQLIDWIAAYLEGVEQYPVLSQMQPGEVRAALPARPPTGVESWSDVMTDVESVIVPGLTHWAHPMFAAYFPANSSYGSVLGEMLATGFGVNGMLWATSPAATEVETLVMDWMIDLLGLPASFLSPVGAADRGVDADTAKGGGVIQGTASEGALCALLAARERASGGTSNRTGATGRFTAYCTAHSHSSLEKAAGIAGVGRDMIRKVECDSSFAMLPDALAAAINADRAAGFTPIFVCANVGSTSSMAIDPVAIIADVCEREGVWLHVDAAMAGIAALCPEYRYVNNGLDRADSYSTNPHKWMGVQFDCSLFWVRDRQALLNALSILPEYLKTSAGDAGQVIDYRDWGIPLGRRFRALKMWTALRLEGVESMQAMIRNHVTFAAAAAEWFSADERFEFAAPVHLNLVCVRHVNGDNATDALINAANKTGRILLTRTVLDGRSALRLSIGTRSTTAAHARAMTALLGSLSEPVQRRPS